MPPDAFETEVDTTVRPVPAPLIRTSTVRVPAVTASDSRVDSPTMDPARIALKVSKLVDTCADSAVAAVLAGTSRRAHCSGRYCGMVGTVGTVTVMVATPPPALVTATPEPT